MIDPMNEHTDTDTVPGPTPTDRSRMAYAAVTEVLQSHGCRIVATMQPEQVGTGPLSRILIGTSWGVMPIET